MKVRLLHILAPTALLLAPAVQGQSQKTASHAPRPGGPSLVYRLTDADSTVYLAGSVHMLRESDLPIPGAIMKAYEDSQRLVFEIDMKSSSDIGMAMKLRAMGSYPAGETIESHLSPGTYAKLKQYFADRNTPFSLFSSLKPGMMVLTISSVEAMKLKARPDLGVELQLFTKATEEGKPSSGLETLEFQVTLLDSLPEKDLDALLSESLDHIEEVPTMLAKTIDAWREGDLKTLEEVVNEQLEESPQFNELMLAKRNASWVPKIKEALARKDNVMIVVGAAHLFGKQGVLALLRQEGLQAEMVRNPTVPASNP